MTPEVALASRDFMQSADKLRTFYHLSEEWTHLVWLLEEPNTDPDEIQDELKKVAKDIRVKAHDIAVVIQALDGLAERQKLDADQQRREIARLDAKSKATHANAERLRDYALRCMQSIGEQRIETGTFTLSVRQNPERVTVLDAGLIPPQFWRQPPIPEKQPDLVGIKAHVKATHQAVPGTVIERGMRLEVS